MKLENNNKNKNTEDVVGIKRSVITKQFLQHVLRKEGKYMGMEILSYNVTMGSKPGDNYMSIIYSIDMELKGEKGTPLKRTILIKCYPNHPQRQMFNSKSNMFFKEMIVYREWMPELVRMQTEVLGLEKEQIIKLPYAPYVYGECIDFQSHEGQTHSTRVLGQLENYIIMENIKAMYGFRMSNRREPLDIHHMRLVISALAKVHSLSWAYKKHVEEDIIGKYSCMVPNTDKEDIATYIQIAHGRITQAVEVFDSVYGKWNVLTTVSLNFRDNTIHQVLKYLQDEDENVKGSGKVLEDALRIKMDPKKYGRSEDYEEIPWRVICHGDCWSNNMMFRYDNENHPVEIILLDLQMPSEACVTTDLQYVVYASTDAELRTNHLDSLLKLYHDEFNANCETLKVKTLPGFNLNELKYRFHRAKLLGFYFCSMLLPMTLKEEEKAKDFESMGIDMDIMKMLSSIMESSDNNVYRKRIIEITRELYEEGIL